MAHAGRTHDLLHSSLPLLEDLLASFFADTVPVALPPMASTSCAAELATPKVVPLRDREKKRDSKKETEREREREGEGERARARALGSFSLASFSAARILNRDAISPEIHCRAEGRFLN